jgi:elongation factor G
MSNDPPLIEVPIWPIDESERERLMRAIVKLAEADASLRFSTDQESGRIVIKGMSELHLDQELDTLKRTHN